MLIQGDSFSDILEQVNSYDTVVLFSTHHAIESLFLL